MYPRLSICFLLALMLSKAGECRKKALSPRAGFLPGSPTQTSPAITGESPGGIRVQPNIGACSADHQATGFKTYIDDEGEETCVCPYGNGFAKVKGKSYCFTCQYENERIVNSRCICIKPQDPMMTATLTAPEGRCVHSAIVPADVGPSALAYARGYRRGRAPSAPRPSYGQRPVMPNPPPSHESCQSVENTHLCRVHANVESFACFNLQKEVERCGDCNNDCNSIPNVEGVLCDQGKCVISSCQRGFRLTANQLTSNAKGGISAECLPI